LVEPYLNPLRSADPTLASYVRAQIRCPSVEVMNTSTAHPRFDRRVLSDQAVSHSPIVELINLTPHPIDVISDDGSILRVFESGFVARVEFENLEVEQTLIGGVVITIGKTRTTPQPPDLPPPAPRTLYVVSRIVASAAMDRDDLVFPDDLVRNDKGAVVGCRRLSHLQ